MWNAKCRKPNGKQVPRGGTPIHYLYISEAFSRTGFKKLWIKALSSAGLLLLPKIVADYEEAFI